MTWYVFPFSESGLSTGVGCLWSVFRRTSQTIGRPSPGSHFTLFWWIIRFQFAMHWSSFSWYANFRFWGMRKVKSLVWKLMRRALALKMMMSRWLMQRWLDDLVSSADMKLQSWVLVFDTVCLMHAGIIKCKWRIICNYTSRRWNPSMPEISCHSKLVTSTSMQFIL